MKQSVTEEREICDFCKINPASYKGCLSCGKAICYDCRKIHAKEYNFAVFFQGSDDGIYCLDCDTRLVEDGTNKLHTAYRRVARLRAEYKAWEVDFKARSDAAEKDVKNYQSDRGEK